MSHTITARHNEDYDAMVCTERCAKDDEFMLFRLLDDDDIPYYEGYATGDHAVLDALDYYMSLTGTTQAQLWIGGADGHWQPLN